MSPPFVTLTRAPASAPTPAVLATRRIASVVPREAPKWTPPSLEDTPKFRVDGHSYSRVRGFGSAAEWHEDFDGVRVRNSVPLADVRTAFDAWLEESGPAMKAKHDDIHAGAAILGFDDGAQLVVLEAFEHIERLLGSVR